ncbi:MAG: Spo0B domain-containing protein [Clostridiales bacterium]|nr:Spo0B domain-containing protein [Clostridiales bacterium]
MDENSFYLTLCIILVVILATCVIVLLKSYMRLLKRTESLLESIENLGKLNDRLRMDRHDYLNHLQIVYGLMELKEYDEMDAYLKKLYKEVMKTGKAIKTKKPAINALLAAKAAEAEAKDMEFVIEVKSDLEKLRIEDWELCKVLSNLIDNAMHALDESDKSEKKIRINVSETKEQYLFEVEDNGPKIPEELREKIFTKGFSTKKESGHGMGLAIVKKVLDENAGSIKVDSNDDETIFSVMFGKGDE